MLEDIKLTYMRTERSQDPTNLLDFPVDWKEPAESVNPIIKYFDQNKKTYALERLMPTSKNPAFNKLLLSPRYVKEKRIIIKRDGTIKPKKEPKAYGPRTDVPIEIDGKIVDEKKKNILVLDKDEMWIYNFKKE